MTTDAQDFAAAVSDARRCMYELRQDPAFSTINTLIDYGIAATAEVARLRAENEGLRAKFDALTEMRERWDNRPTSGFYPEAHAEAETYRNCAEEVDDILCPSSPSLPEEGDNQ
ncbi:hypothetical protein SAMN05444157_1603 [Frankineae bacterium MT45]|nr:hypothetical protein SAMN05444157_1603 [Frankineae bacterium MT45]